MTSFIKLASHTGYRYLYMLYSTITCFLVYIRNAAQSLNNIQLSNVYANDMLAIANTYTHWSYLIGLWVSNRLYIIHLVVYNNNLFSYWLLNGSVGKEQTFIDSDLYGTV